MRILSKENGFINKVLSSQKSKKDETYRLSIFCRVLEVDGSYIVFNNLTKAFVELTEKEAKLLEKLPLKYCDELEEFINRYFLFPLDYNEIKLADDVYNFYKMTHTKKGAFSSYTIFPTSACNARCYYCFEEGAKHITMTPQVTEDVIDFIVKKSFGNKIRINWFGGEPLCNMKSIDRISEALRDKGIKYSAGMTSNALLFDENVAKKAKELWHLDKIQVTLDGTEDVYNRIKDYKDKSLKSPFKMVINNINYLIQNGIFVSIRLNVSDENSEDLYDLVRYLSTALIKDKNLLNIYCINVIDYSHKCSDDVRVTNDDRLIKLTKFIAENGLSANENYKFRMGLNTSVGRGCMATNPECCVIGPDGTLGRCEHFFEEEHTYGSIYSDEINQKEYDYWDEFKRNDYCDKCMFRSSCQGDSHCPNFYNDCDEFYRKYRLERTDEFLKEAYRRLK
ncbi:MAG: radical SAM protein [Clostridia bacterium]|nr:radical SAM protein [Clostridia bacterium]